MWPLSPVLHFRLCPGLPLRPLSPGPLLQLHLLSRPPVFSSLWNVSTETSFRHLQTSKGKRLIPHHCSHCPISYTCLFLSLSLVNPAPLPPPATRLLSSWTCFVQQLDLLCNTYLSSDALSLQFTPPFLRVQLSTVCLNLVPASNTFSCPAQSMSGLRWIFDLLATPLFHNHSSSSLLMKQNTLSLVQAGKCLI